jgi:predicted nucleotidyltransferase
MEGVMARESIDMKTLQLIKQVILEEAGKLGLEVEKVILFGSRARGEARPDSDYDILVVVKGRVDRRVRRELSARVSTRIVRLLLVPVDLIVTSSERWREYSDVVGTVEEVAASEGVPA